MKYTLFHPNTEFNPSQCFCLGYPSEPDGIAIIESSFTTFQEALERRVILNGERKPTLQEWFDYEPPAEYLVEIMEKDQPTGIFYIPVLNVKEMLAKDFEWWGTGNYNIVAVHYGNATMLNASIELIIRFRGEVYRLPGGYTFNVSRYGQNQDWSAIGISMCIKNAAKNIGRKYGMYLNKFEGDIEAISTELPVMPAQKMDKVKDGIDKLLKSQKTPNH